MLYWRELQNGYKIYQTLVVAQNPQNPKFLGVYGSREDHSVFCLLADFTVV